MTKERRVSVNGVARQPIIRDGESAAAQKPEAPNQH
jgi:hypothetical protein